MFNRQTTTFLKQRMEEAGIRPVSKFGQNFLIDLNLVNMIADSANITKQDVVVEVGADRVLLRARRLRRMWVAEDAGVEVGLDGHVAERAR